MEKKEWEETILWMNGKNPLKKHIMLMQISSGLYFVKLLKTFGIDPIGINPVQVFQYCAAILCGAICELRSLFPQHLGHLTPREICFRLLCAPDTAASLARCWYNDKNIHKGDEAIREWLSQRAMGILPDGTKVLFTDDGEFMPADDAAYIPVD
jgi:hypothetical protein